jgi:hypothetical protein
MMCGDEISSECIASEEKSSYQPMGSY